MTTTCSSVWHRDPAPDVQVAVWRTTNDQGVSYAVGIHGNGLDRLSADQTDHLARIIRNAAAFARRSQALADAGTRRRSA